MSRSIVTEASLNAPALPFPLTALIGQDALREALLLVAVDPSIGGVLVSGPRGTAKSTAARALAELLTDGCFVTLPLGASEERLIGSLDIEEALRGGGVKFSPGLLALADGGVLYVDEVNLLADALVDAVLDVAASGVNLIERDGISHRHAARFVLIGTMNPEEGELRPQLLDRFGLMVELDNCFDPRLRQEIVKARFAFDLDPQAFRATHAQALRQLRQRLADARAALSGLALDDEVHEAVGQRCIAAAVDGMRADLVMVRAARALAALEAAPRVTREHVGRVAELVLRHRRHAADDASSVGVPPANGPAQRQNGPRDTRGSGNADGFDRRTPGNPSNPAAATHAGAATGTSADEPDWGWLPPEPAGTVPVKGVIPLSAAKKR